MVENSMAQLKLTMHMEVFGPAHLDYPDLDGQELNN